MSIQSININNIETLLKESESTIKKETKNFLLLDGFRIGKGMCQMTQKHSMKLYDIIEKNNCVLNEYLSEIIKKGPDCEYKADLEITGDKESSRPAEDLYKVWLSSGNKGTYSDFLDVLFNVNVDVWDEAEW